MDFLPDHILVSILQLLSPYDQLFHIPLVCHRWHQLNRIACERRKHLFLFDPQTSQLLNWLYYGYGIEFVHHGENSLLLLKRKQKEKNVDYYFKYNKNLKNSNILILKTFPNICHLSFSGQPDNDDSVQLLFHLLTGEKRCCNTGDPSCILSKQLKSLKILIYNNCWDRFTYPDEQYRNEEIRYGCWNQVFACLNSGHFATNLHHLTLFDGSRHGSGLYPRESTFNQLQLDQLASLKELYFGIKCFTLPSTLFGSLNRLKYLKHFGILYTMSMEHFNDHHQVPLKHFDQTISDGITHLTLLYKCDRLSKNQNYFEARNNSDISKWFSLISEKFPNLTYLHLNVTNLSFVTTTHRRLLIDCCIAKMTHLQHLRLSSNTLFEQLFTFDTILDVMFDEIIDQVNINSSPLQNITKLTITSTNILSDYNQDHHHHNPKMIVPPLIDQIFPNLQQFEIDNLFFVAKHGDIDDVTKNVYSDFNLILKNEKEVVGLEMENETKEIELLYKLPKSWKGPFLKRSPLLYYYQKDKER